MLRLIPQPWHRAAYRLAHRARLLVWKVTKPQLQGVAVLATDLNDQLLLIRLSYGNGSWNVPSGGIDAGENPPEAAMREFREETGCEASLMKPLGVQVEHLSGATNTVHVFACKASGQPRADMREVIEARYFPMHSLPEPLSDATRRRLELYKAASQQR